MFSYFIKRDFPKLTITRWKLIFYNIYNICIINIYFGRICFVCLRHTIFSPFLRRSLRFYNLFFQVPTFYFWQAKIMYCESIRKMYNLKFTLHILPDVLLHSLDQYLWYSQFVYFAEFVKIRGSYPSVIVILDFWFWYVLVKKFVFNINYFSELAIVSLSEIMYSQLNRSYVWVGLKIITYSYHWLSKKFCSLLLYSLI